MVTQFVTDETPIAMLTVGQLKEVLVTHTLTNESISTPQPPNEKRYVYGLRGIRQLFSVCHSTAQRYKNGVLRPSIIQNGRKIIVDVDKAIMLFNQTQEQSIQKRGCNG